MYLMATISLPLDYEDYCFLKVNFLAIGWSGSKQYAWDSMSLRN
jgi:hypothetical protein